MTTHTIVVICAPLLFLVAFSMGRSSIQRKRMPGLYLRPTGEPKPPASRTPRVATIRAQSVTATMDSSSSRQVHGFQPVAKSALIHMDDSYMARRMLRDPSRLTGRGWSTLGTGTPGANGQRHADAA